MALKIKHNSSNCYVSNSAIRYQIKNKGNKTTKLFYIIQICALLQLFIAQLPEVIRLHGPVLGGKCNTAGLSQYFFVILETWKKVSYP